MHPLLEKLLYEAIGVGRKAASRAVDSAVEDIHEYSAGVAKRSAEARQKIREREKIDKAKRAASAEDGDPE